MRVLLKAPTCLPGQVDAIPAGTVITVAADLGQQLVALGAAEAADDPPPAEDP